jgi:hypothetical protein
VNTAPVFYEQHYISSRRLSSRRILPRACS